MKSNAQILDEWIVEHCAPGDLLCSYKLAELTGLGMPNCSTHLSQRSSQGYLKREARIYKNHTKGERPFVMYKVTESMLDAYFNYNKHNLNVGRRPVGTKVNRPHVPKLIVEIS